MRWKELSEYRLRKTTDGRRFVEDPTKEQIKNWLKSAKYSELRAIVTPNKLWIIDSYYVSHQEFAQELFRQGLIQEDEPGEEWIYIVKDTFHISDMGMNPEDQVTDFYVSQMSFDDDKNANHIPKEVIEKYPSIQRVGLGS